MVDAKRPQISDSDDEYFLHISKMQRDRIYGKNNSKTPTWLIEGALGDPIWITTGATVDDKNHTISFDHPLPDGCLLTDPKYNRLLLAIQNNAIALRSGHIDATVDPYRLAMTVNWQKKLAGWLVLHADEYDPQKFGFMNFDDNGVKVLLAELAEGNWSEALRHTQRFLSILYKEIYNLDVPDDILASPFDLPTYFLLKARSHLKSLGHLRDKKISRNYLAGILTAHVASFKNVRFRAFLAQFEDTTGQNNLLVGRSNDKTNIGHKNPLLSEAATRRTTQATFSDELSHLQLFAKCRERFPEEIPILQINRQELISAFFPSFDITRHTPKIPLSIGITILGGAIEWVMRFGTAFVRAIVYYAEICETTSLGSKWRDNAQIAKHFETTRLKFLTEGYEGYPTVPLAEALNITTFNTTLIENDGISFTTAMQSFIGACVTILSMLKPMRVGEICKQDRDCLEFEDIVGGAFFEHLSEKNGYAGVNDKISRPIPYIAARVIQLLQMMGTQLETVYKISPKKKLLFLFPREKNLGCPGLRLLPNRIDSCLNAFCQRLGLPKDDHGRSWQLRVHEARKFYLMTLVHHEGESGRFTASYMAGHLHLHSLDEYLSGDIPTDEILMYKAECITEKLIRLEQKSIAPDENKGLVALHAEVKRKFQVDSIRGRSISDYNNLVRQLLASKAVELRTYVIRITTKTGEIIDNEFAVKYKEQKDEKFTS